MVITDASGCAFTLTADVNVELCNTDTVCINAIDTDNDGLCDDIDDCPGSSGTSPDNFITLWDGVGLDTGTPDFISCGESWTEDGVILTYTGLDSSICEFGYSNCNDQQLPTSGLFITAGVQVDLDFTDQCVNSIVSKVEIYFNHAGCNPPYTLESFMFSGSSLVATADYTPNNVQDTVLTLINVNKELVERVMFRGCCEEWITGVRVYYECFNGVNEDCDSTVACTDTINCVFPGDANNGLRVNNYDLLNIGFGFGTSGPARDQVSIAPQYFFCH